MKVPDQKAVIYFEHLKQDFQALKCDWRIYRRFWGANEETFDLLKSVSPYVSRTLERALFERVLLGLRKITDQTEKKGKRSISILGLRDAFTDPDDELRDLISKARKECKFAKNWSDKRIAHSDFSYKIENTPLEPASRAAVETALAAISEVILWVSETHFNATLVFDTIIKAPTDEDFLKCLYEGKSRLDAKEQDYQRMLKQGNFQGARELDEYPDWLQRSERP